MQTSSAFSFAQEQPQPETVSHAAETAKPTLRELHERYKPIVLEAVTQDIRYRNACGHSDYENAMNELFGDKSCYRLKIRNFGGINIAE